MDDPLKLLNNRVAASRALQVSRSVAQARTTDNANRRTDYKGFNAASARAVVQVLGGEPLLGPRPITNGAIAFGTPVRLTRSGAIPAIDQMPSPRRKIKKSKSKSIFSTKYIVSLRLLDKTRTEVMAQGDSVYSQPFVVLKVFYSTKLANWELQDARINRVEFRGCGFWSSQMEAVAFERTVETYTGSGSSGYYNFDGSYGATQYTFTLTGTRDYTTTPPTVTETIQTNPSNWSGNPGDSMWTIGEWIYQTAYKQTNPVLTGTASRTNKEVATFDVSTRTDRFAGSGNAKSFGAFRGKLAVLNGQASEKKDLDSLTFVGIGGTNTETSQETKLVTGQTLLFPARKRNYSFEAFYKTVYVAPNTTITDTKTADISTCIVVREDLKFAIIHRETSDKNFFLSSGKTDKKINSAPVVFAEISSAISLQIPAGQSSVTLNISAKTPSWNNEVAASSFVGQDFIVATPAGAQFKVGYGKATSLVLGAVEQGVQLLSVAIAVERVEVAEWDSQAEGKTHGAVYSNNGSLLQAVALADDTTANLKRLNFLKDNKIYLARNITQINQSEIDSYAEVFNLEESGNIINVVRQELPIAGKIKPLVVQEPPQTFEILDISCNPKNKDYPFKVLFAGRDGTYIRLYVGGDTSPIQIGKKMLMTKYEIDKAFINNVRSIWTEEE